MLPGILKAPLDSSRLVTTPSARSADSIWRCRPLAEYTRLTRKRRRYRRSNGITFSANRRSWRCGSATGQMKIRWTPASA
jgi:hypothetical protein